MEARLFEKYRIHTVSIVHEKVNGIRIEKLEDAIAAFEKGTNAFDMIEFLPHANIECLDHTEAEKANDAILKTYGLPSDRRL